MTFDYTAFEGWTEDELCHIMCSDLSADFAWEKFIVRAIESREKEVEELNIQLKIVKGIQK